MTTLYEVKTEVFQGPLELLLSLIEKRKLLINEIALAQVADDYIAFIQDHPEFPIGQTAHFILVASTLVLIKSKSLLPQLELSEEEQESVEDLERRLKLYQKYRDIGDSLKKIFGKNIMYERTFVKVSDPVFVPDKDCQVDALQEAIGRVLTNLPKKEDKTPKAVVKKVVSLEEMIDSLTTRVTSAMKMSFHDFTGQRKRAKGIPHTPEERVNIVVGFLAMLELVKQGAIRVEQESHFDDIVMETEQVGLPHYG